MIDPDACPLVVPIAELRRHPAPDAASPRRSPSRDLGITTASVPDGAPIEVDVELETLSNGLVATGTVTVPWVGDCRRCLTPVEGSTVARVKEIFEPRPVEGETYPMADDLVDLEPMVRDAVLLALPLAPLCAPECLGPAPEAFPAVPLDGVEEPEPEAAVDPRWAALGDLHFDSAAEDG